MFPIKEVVDIYIVFREYEEFFTELFSFAEEMQNVLPLKELIVE